MAKSKLVEAHKKIENGVVEGYKKMEGSVVGGFQKISDKFVDNYLTKNGESIEEAKARLAKEQHDREEKARQEMEARKTEHDNIVKKNLEASLNAGKR